MIPRALHAVFPSHVRDRGDAYFADGRVRILRADAGLLLALVRGGRPWSVRLRASRDEFSMTCACPYAAENWICKHLWATIRAADEAGELAPLVTTAGRFDRSVFVRDDEPIDRDIADRGTAPMHESSRTTEPAKPQPVPGWKIALERMRMASAYEPAPAQRAEWPADRRIVYVVDVPASNVTPGLIVEIATEKMLPDGSTEPPRKLQLGVDVWLQAPDPVDRTIAQMLLGARALPTWASANASQTFVLPAAAFPTTLRRICDTGRCRLRRDRGERPTEAMEWDTSEPWTFALRLAAAPDSPGLELSGVFRRGDEQIGLREPAIVHGAGVLAARGKFSLFQSDASFQLVSELRKARIIIDSEADIPALLSTLYAFSKVPPIELPPNARVDQSAPAPVPCLAVTNGRRGYSARARYSLSLSYDYGSGLRVDALTERATVFHPQTMRLVRRDLSAEAAARQRVLELGARAEQDWSSGRPVLTLTIPKFERVARSLLAEGWQVNVEGISFRPLDTVRSTVSSGIDWFDLHSVATFGGREVPISAVLDAIRRGDDSVDLGDGSRGILSPDWARRLAPLLAAPTTHGDTTRFTRAQAGILDALLASLPEPDVDETFETARAELRAFERVAPADPPPTFCGTLRPYQREGLGWLNFLGRFSLGGCLADDMGLGKTIQVLALLDERRAAGAGPSMVVVPKSLVFNWMQEAARFAPSLRVYDHTGVTRRATTLDLTGVDLVVTTYGTMRRDIMTLREIEFDYIVLDEAQAIKNATTASAKAARLLRARNRLALSGTPIENRIDELWSLMEFLNPGILGTSSAFGALVRRRSSDSDDTSAKTSEGAQEFLARALKPVILRRTKSQVADDLPRRVEQTLMVELEAAQRTFYDRLLEEYRAELLPHVERVGAGRAKIKILEALLRLRQAACHPGLLGAKDADAPSAKLDVLLPMLAEARAEGHKTLVFSQFTSFLALLRHRLDAGAHETPYAYLDGKTRDRQTQVERFQNDENCPLFLISLKAGGHGLNLTAADYVFLLDPWWNPAVEAQAIDRAHRIGQKRHVIATRLVARETIEEKILELQRSKRELADAILGEESGLIAKIGAEELRMLLG